MTTRQWKPGDVALVRDACEYDGVEPGEKVRIFVRSREAGKMVWWGPDGFLPPESDLIESVRPLVVIDPEDMLAVERLQDLYLAAEAKGLSGLSMLAALREFADPKPPFEEPTGLGAVVEDDEGHLWIRRGPVHFVAAELHADSGPRTWGEIDAVRVLSQGVAADA